MNPINLSVISEERTGQVYRNPRVKTFDQSNIQVVGSDGKNAVVKDTSGRPYKTYTVGESVAQVTFLLNYPKEKVYAEIETISAASTTQSGATLISKSIAVVGTASASNDSIKLPKANEDQVDNTYLVLNGSSAAVKVWPNSGDSINDLDVDIPVTLQPGDTASFYIREPLDDLD